MRDPWRRRTVIPLFVLALTSAAPTTQEVERYQPPSIGLPAGAERAYRQLAPRVELIANFTAMDIVRFMDQYWRLAGNAGFNNSIDHLRGRLLATGFADVANPKTPQGAPVVRVEEWGQARGWDYQLGTLSFADDGEVLLSRVRDRVS